MNSVFWPFSQCPFSKLKLKVQGFKRTVRLSLKGPPIVICLLFSPSFNINITVIQSLLHKRRWGKEIRLTFYQTDLKHHRNSVISHCNCKTIIIINSDNIVINSDVTVSRGIPKTQKWKDQKKNIADLLVMDSFVQKLEQNCQKI